MEYNNIKTINRIHDLLFLIESDAATLKSEGVRLEASTEQLEACYRTCELMEDYLERAKTLIGKILDEREDMEAENEGE
jgi:exonuclease VII small subunit